ncbi:MAG: STAS domain-containing protein [Myxococcales bacterium]|nr:STAS domain-containing protein [Myxococcales bacterium]
MLDEFLAHCPALLFVAEVDGNLRSCSAALTQHLGQRTSLLELGEGDGDREALEIFLAALARGEDAHCKLYARDHQGGKVEIGCSGKRAQSGLIHGAIEVLATFPHSSIEHSLLHALINTLDIVLWVIDRDGTFVYFDGKAMLDAGLGDLTPLGKNLFELYPPETAAFARGALEGQEGHHFSESYGHHWESWSIPMREAPEDPITHVFGLTTDITARVEHERELDRRMQTIREQQHAIQQLSTPLINVWDHVLAVPLVGELDGQRSSELSERLLAELHRTRTRFAILDLTGLESIDTATANHILRLLASMALLGVEGLVTGVSARVAQTMVGVGIDFDTVQVHRTLREGLRYCMKTLLAE